jgi:hypothetical protein
MRLPRFQIAFQRRIASHLKRLLSFMMFAIPAAGQAGDGGIAIGHLWSASAAEYQATAEAQLEALGARNVQRAGPAGAAVAGFLQMFSGGGGAPLDLVRPKSGAFRSGASSDAQM